MTWKELTSYKWIIRGAGQVRPYLLCYCSVPKPMPWEYLKESD
jgi:hypothetical protein